VDCPKFRVRAGIMGEKENSHGPRQSPLEFRMPCWMNCVAGRPLNAEMEHHLAKYQRRFPGFDDKIVLLYARDMSTHDI